MKDFIKTTTSGTDGATPDAAPAALSAKERTLLIRKGNEQFNAGEFETAGRIFKTTGYRDGLIRLGDHYRAQNAIIDAFWMYRAAEAKEQTENIIGIFARSVQYWLKENV